MVRGRVRQLQVLTLAAALAACTAPETQHQLDVDDIDPRAVVQLDGTALAALMADGGRVQLVEIGQGRHARLIASHRAVEEGDSVQLVAYAGETGMSWNSFMYGTAAPGTARVELTGHAGRGGRVVDGAWVIALQEKDVNPDVLTWRFIGTDGELLRHGRGILAANP